ncbi:MAG: NIPSNAP family protein [Proteobacteria bacterium]|nr:NIPSNAP family protein [Pseudomonadota bacterium]
MFFELRQYRTKPGMRADWVRYMEEVIIPFQVSKGMVVSGSFVGQEEDDLYIWLRRFDSEEERAQYMRIIENSTYGFSF